MAEAAGVECLLMEGPVETRVVMESWMTGPPIDLSLTVLAPPCPASASAGLVVCGRTQELGPFPLYQSLVLALIVPVPPIWRCFVRPHS